MLKTRPELSISPEKVCFIIVKAREFDLQDLAIEEDDSSNGLEKPMASVLEEHHDPAFKELCGFIKPLTEDEQIDLVALTWVGPLTSTTGTTCGRKRHARTTSARQRTSWPSHSCRTTWRRGSCNSPARATIFEGRKCDPICNSSLAAHSPGRGR